MNKKKFVKYGMVILIAVLAVVLVIFAIKGNRSSDDRLQEIEGGLKSEETDEGQENVIDFEDAFGDQESDEQASEDDESNEDTQDYDSQNGDAQNNGSENGDTQNNGSKNDGTQGSGAQNGGTQEGGGQDGEEDSKWGPLF